MFYWDPTYILVLIGIVLSAIASWNVSRTFKKYSRQMNSRGYTAQEVAEMIMRSAGIFDVRIEPVSGSLTDHYSPNEKVLRLSESVYNQRSVAALGVAAHECGHAIQHKEGYAPLQLRSASVPLANIGSTIAFPLILIGLGFSITGLAKAGVFFFLFVVLFQLITLPVEFDASHRALKILETNGILMGGEMSGARRVLTAAAMTYVAALLSSILQLLRLILIVNGNRRN